MASNPDNHTVFNCVACGTVRCVRDMRAETKQALGIAEHKMTMTGFWQLQRAFEYLAGQRPIDVLALRLLVDAQSACIAPPSR
jgi:hypothetical protein